MCCLLAIITAAVLAWGRGVATALSAWRGPLRRGGVLALLLVGVSGAAAASQRPPAAQPPGLLEIIARLPLCHSGQPPDSRG